MPRITIAATTVKRASLVSLTAFMLAFIVVSAAGGIVHGQVPPPPNPFAMPLTVERSTDRLSATAMWTPNSGAEYQAFFVVAKLLAGEPDPEGFGVKVDTFRYVDYPLAGNVGQLAIADLDASRVYLYGVISTSRDGSGSWVWGQWEIVSDEDPVGGTPVPATATATATATAQWNGYGDPGVVTYPGWKHWTDSTSKYRLYVPQTWNLSGDSDASTILYFSPDKAATALVYEFDLDDATQADLRAVAMRYVEILKGKSSTLGTPSIRSKQNEITGWTEYVIQWENRPVPGDCHISGKQVKELWVLGERGGTSDEGRLLALELARCNPPSTNHQPTLNAIESRFQYWR